MRRTVRIVPGSRGARLRDGDTMRARLLASAVVALLAGFMPSAAASDVNTLNTVDQYVAALRQDPILVQQVMGAGHTDAVRGEFKKLAAALPYPVYVALVQAPTDLVSDRVSTDLASAIRRKLGRPGLYVVAAEGDSVEIQVTGSVPDQTLLSLATYDGQGALVKALGQWGGRSETKAIDAQLVLETAASPQLATYRSVEGSTGLLSQAQIDALAAEPWALAWEAPERDYESHVGKRWIIGTLVGLGVLLAVAQTMFGWPGWRREKARVIEGRLPLERLRRRAEDAVTRLATGLAELPATPTHPDIAGDALSAREAAEHFLKGGYLDLVGALALAESGLRDLDRAQMANPGDPYRPCYFNPLHKPAMTKTTWLFDDAEVKVPACRRCETAVSRGKTPDVLRVSDSETAKAYFEVKSIWTRTGYGALVDHFGATVLHDRAGHE